MESFLLMVIAALLSTSIEAYDEPQIEIYEIRKARDDPDLRLDFQYYDPNEEKFEYRQNRDNYKKINLNVDIITNSLIDRLKRIVNTKYYDSNTKNDDYISSFKDLKDENIFENEKTPVVIIADNKVLYHLVPQKSRSLHNKLQSVLRSINIDNEVEDRTAPPRTKIVYDYDYD